MSTIAAIKSGVDSILEFVYPSCCLNCGSYIESPGDLICHDCWDKISTFDHIFCGNCENPLEVNIVCENCGGDKTMPIIALGQYTDPLSEIIRYFKYRDFQKLGPILAEKLSAKYITLINKEKIDLIIPIPLHSYRLKTRGYNQSQIIADLIGKRLDLAVIEKGIIKTKHNKYQKSLDPFQREKNVENVYEIGDFDVENKRIMLVDDVITTGATLREAKKVLHRAGGKVVLFVVIAGTGYWK